MNGFLAHRWGRVFVADCGARNVKIAPDEARVTCPACKSRPADPALWAERDQFAANLRDVQARRARPRSECATPCCDACGGRGADLSGPCGDCYGTGHVHPLGATADQNAAESSGSDPEAEVGCDE